MDSNEILDNNWSSLEQRDKYEIIRDYVRRGFDNLDDIINDYEMNRDGVDTALSSADDPYSALKDVIDEWYSDGLYDWK